MATVMARGNSDMEFAAVEMLNLKSDSNVAMIGCGPGIGVVECARRISSGIVIGLDPSIVMTERTRKRCCRARVEQVTKVERAAAESLPLSDRSQDAVVSVNNIQLWTNRSAGLDECTRVLVPGGVIVVLLHMWAIPSVLPRKNGSNSYAKTYQPVMCMLKNHEYDVFVLAMLWSLLESDKSNFSKTAAPKSYQMPI